MRNQMLLRHLLTNRPGTLNQIRPWTTLNPSSTLHFYQWMPCLSAQEMGLPS